MMVGVRITCDGSVLAEDVDGGGVCWPACFLAYALQSPI